MENSLYNSIKDHYTLSDALFAEIFEDDIIPQLVFECIPVELPEVIITGAQPGSGKTELQKVAESRFHGNVVVCNADNLRDYHPLADEIKSKYPDLYPVLTADYARKWNDLLCDYCRKNKLNYILETTFSSGEGLNETIRELKDNNYKVDILLLAVSPKLSLLGTYLRYEKSLLKSGLGRKVSKDAHDIRFKAIPATIEAISQKLLFDNIYIYSRSVVLESTNLVEGVTLVAHNPVDIMSVYNEEVQHPWPAKLKAYYQQTYTNILHMMKQRSATHEEIALFKKELQLQKVTIPKQDRSNKRRPCM